MNEQNNCCWIAIHVLMVGIIGAGYVYILKNRTY